MNLRAGELLLRDKLVEMFGQTTASTFQVQNVPSNVLNIIDTAIIVNLFGETKQSGADGYKDAFFRNLRLREQRQDPRDDRQVEKQALVYEEVDQLVRFAIANLTNMKNGILESIRKDDRVIVFSHRFVEGCILLVVGFIVLPEDFILHDQILHGQNLILITIYRLFQF
jgi:hypothetical protein